MITVLLDNGHGNDTPGKRSPIWEDGSQLFEFEFNRAIVKRLMLLLDRDDIPHVNIVPELKDISLQERCKRANEIYKTNKECIYLSIHADAFSVESANGFSMYTSVGQTKSDKIAQVLIEEYQIHMPEIRLRADNSDGDKDKEAHFYVLKNTNMPAVLIESAFYTNRKECKLLASEDGRDRIADAIYAGIKKYIGADTQ
jgi:N-acetylmuramoyl-L-alanine amidase